MDPWTIAYIVAAVVGGFLIARSAKPPKTKPQLLDESNAPSATEGWLFPVFYGTVDQLDPNFVAYWDPEVQTDTRDGIKYRSYSVKWHLECSQGPNDALVWVKFDDKIAYGVPNGDEELTESQTFNIDAPDLLGGRDREGGVVAEVDLMMGEADQGQNARLVAKFGSLMPAFRGVAGLVFDGVYAINNPIPKLPATRWRRLREGWRNDECWYPETVEVGAQIFEEGALVAFAPMTSYAHTEQTYLLENDPVTPVTGLWAGDVLYTSDFQAQNGSWISSVDRIPGYPASARIDYAGGGGGIELNTTANSRVFEHSDNQQPLFPEGRGEFGMTFYIDEEEFFSPPVIDVDGIADIVATTISFVAPYTIHDSAGGFVAAGFAPGMLIKVYESGANDGFYLLEGVTTTDLTLVDEGYYEQELTNQAAGPIVQIYSAIAAADSIPLACCGRPQATAPDGSYSWSLSLRPSDRFATSGLLYFSWLIDDSPATYVTISTLSEVRAFATHHVRVVVTPVDDDSSVITLYLNGDSTSAPFVPMVDCGDAGTTARLIIGSVNHYPGPGPQNYETPYLVNDVYLTNYVVERVPGDMNPAHMVYDVRTNGYRGVGYPVAMIDDDAMRAAALTYWTEGFGLSGKWNRQDKPSEFIRVINETTDSVERISPTTGKYSIKPIRADYNVDDLPVFDESNIISIDDFTAKGYGDLCSRITVRYTHPDTGKQATTAAWNNPATLSAQGRRVEDTVDYPLIRQHELAARACAREGIKRSHELRAWTMAVNREGYGRQKGDAIVVSWPKLGMASVVVRIVAVNYGSLKNRVIKFGVVEDVFGMPISTYTTPASSLWEAPDFEAEPVTIQTAMEMPYWFVLEALGVSDTAALDSAAGFTQSLAVQPSGVSLGYDLWRQTNAGGYVEETTDSVFAITDTLSSGISASATTIPVSGVGLANLEIGDLLQLGEGADAEIVRLTVEYASGNVGVTRGHLDTTPVSHDAGTRLWYLANPGFLQDDTEYTDADEVDYKPLTRTSEDVLDISDATAESITLASRQVRPIPPGNVTVNTEAWPTLLAGALTVAWAHRDRLSHSDTTLQAATGITTEAGVTYNAYAYNDDTDALLDSDTGLSGTSWLPTITTSCVLRIEIESERDGFVSWQRQIRVFDYATSEFRLDASGDYALDASGDYRQEA